MGVPATIYAERTPAEQLGSRLPALVVRVAHTRERERRLGVNLWDGAASNLHRIHVRVSGEQPLAFHGTFAQPAIAVDMRIYCARLLEDFEARGGQVVLGALERGDVERLAATHDLMVVATGRGSLSTLFPRIAAHSPFTSPPRLLCAGLFRGVGVGQPGRGDIVLVPGQGEIFVFPIFSYEPGLTGIGFEIVPGGAFDALSSMRHAEDPRRFEATVLDFLCEHAPEVYSWIDPRMFRLTRPLDLLQGSITPTVRRGYAELGNGKYAVALGDAHVLNDPILGQGANTASYAAWQLGEAITEATSLDEAFCRRFEQRIWAYSGPVTEYNNAMLQPPAEHMIEFLVAAAHNQAIADAFVNFFNTPVRGWEILSRPERTSAFLCQFGWNGMPTAVAAA